MKHTHDTHKPQQPCMLCEELPTPSAYSNMINEALFDRYSSTYPEIYLSAVEDLVEKVYTEDAALFREYLFVDDEDEFLSRQYRIDEWNRKITILGDYYGHLKEVPLFFGLPVELAYYKYHDKKKEYQYKLLKREMGEEVESLSSVRDSENSRRHNGTSVAHILKDMTLGLGMDESRAFQDVCGRLGDLVRSKGRRIKKLLALPQLPKESQEKDGFENYLKENQSNKMNPKRRFSRKNMISGDNEHNIPLYAFRKLQKTRNTSVENGFKGSMESTMSKKNISNGNKNIHIQNQLGDNRDNKNINQRPALRRFNSINGLRFRTIEKRPSVTEIYGTNASRKNSLVQNTLGRTDLVNFKKRVVSGRSQSVLKVPTRPSSVNLKARSKSINTLKHIPPPEKNPTPTRRYSPHRKISSTDVSSNIVTSSCNLKRRPSPYKGKPSAQSLVPKEDLQMKDEAKQRVDKLLDQKLLLGTNPHSLYERLKKGR